MRSFFIASQPVTFFWGGPWFSAIFQDCKRLLKKYVYSRISKIQFLREYLDLGKNKNISSHLLIEICSFPRSFVMTEPIRGYQKDVFLTTKSGGKNHHFFNHRIFICKGKNFLIPHNRVRHHKRPRK